MGNIQQNEQYSTGTTLKPVKAPTIASYSGAIGAMQGFPTQKAPVSGDFSQQLSKLKAGEFNRPANTQIEKPAAGTQYTPIPADYAGFVNPFKSSESVPSVPGATIRTIPGAEGQYLIDRNNLKNPLKSARGYTPEEKALLLGNRSSMLYQVDHIIPIWAGGADTLANKQVLANEMHNDKTRAQAVTLSLLSNGLIDVDQARVQAMQWKTRDLSDVPMPDDLGRIPLEQAKEIQARWDKQRVDPGYGTLLGAPMKDIISGIPETMKNWGKGVLPDPVREFGKGLVSGATGGWVPYEQDGTSTSGMLAGVAGNIAGMLVPAGLLARVLGTAGRALTTSRIGSKIIKPLSLESEAKIMNFAKSDKYGSSLVKNLRYGDLAKNTGALVLYGQLSRDGFENRTENFWTNVGYGVVSGVVPPSISGAVKAGGLAMALGVMVDPSNPRQAVINGVTVGALHGLGAKGTNASLDKKMQEISPMLEKGILDDVQRTAINVVNPYLPKEFPTIGAHEDPSFIASKFSEAELDSLQKIALQKNAAQAKILPFDEVDANRQRIVTAFNQLRISKLPEDEAARAHLQNIVSMQKKVNQTNSFTTPPEAVNTANKFDDKLMQFSLAAHDADTPSGNYPTGSFRLSGLGSNDLDEAGSLYYLKAKKEGRASPNLFGVWTPEMEPLIRSVNNSYTPEEILAKQHKPSQNPHNVMPIYGIVKEPNGGKTVVRVGWAPREWKIGNPDAKVDQNRYSYNQTDYAKDMAKKGTPLLGTDSKLNKDALSNAANENGIKTVFFNFKDGGLAKGSEKPYMIATVNDENWARSIEHAKALNGIEHLSSEASLLRQVKNGLNAKSQSAAIGAIKDKIETPSDVALQGAPVGHDPIYRDSTMGILNESRAALSANTPEEMASLFNKNVGMRLTPEETNVIFNRRNILTNKELLNTIGTARGEGRLSPVASMMYANYVKPYLMSPAFKKWEMSKVFPEMRVVGGVKSVESNPHASSMATSPEAVAARGTEIDRRMDVFNIDKKLGLSPDGVSVTTGAPPIKPQEPASPEMKPTVTVQEQVSAMSTTAQHPTIVNRVVDLATKVMPKKKAPVQQSEVDFTKVPSSTTYVPTTQAKQPAVVPQKAPQQEVAVKPTETPSAPAGRAMETTQPLDMTAWKKLTTKTTRQTFAKKEQPLVGPDENVSLGVRDLVDRGLIMLDQMTPSLKRGKDTSTSLAKKIGEVIKKITPSGEYTPIERSQIMKEARARLMGPAERRVKEMINPEQEIAFKMGGLPEGEVAKALIKDMTDANIANAIGNRERAIAILEKHPIDDVANTARALGMAGEDGESGILSILKEWTGEKRGDFSMLKMGDKALVSQRVWNNFKKMKASEGEKIIAPIKAGLKNEPNTYEHSYAFTLDKLLKNAFGENYDKKTEEIGKLFSTGKSFRDEMRKQYELSDPESFGGEITHTKEFIVPRAEGAKTRAAQYKIARAKQLSEESDINKYKDLMSGSEKSVMDGEDMSGMQIKSKTQLENIGGLTNADIETMPGLTALAMGAKFDQVRGAIEDARGFMQVVQKVINSDKKFSAKDGKLTDQEKFSFLPEDVKMKALAGRGNLVKETDRYIENIFSEYKKLFPKRRTWSPETASEAEKATINK